MSVLSLTEPTSRIETGGPAPVRIGNSSRSLIVPTTEFMGEMRVSSPMLRLPDGTMTLPVLTARITSSGAMPYDRSRSGSTRITIVRWLPPNGGGEVSPGKVANWGRTRFSARSWISPRLRLSLLNTRYPTGTVPASNRMMNGPTVPGGMKARARLTYPMVCDSASDMSVPAWNVSLSRAVF